MMNNHNINILVNDLPDIAIVAQGEFITNSILLNKLKSAEYIICCDGAIKNLIKENIQPDLIIGDCDSLPENIIHQFNVIQLSDQNSNDLTKALNYIKEKNIKEVSIFCASGLREDHSLANLAIFLQQIDRFEQIHMISNYGIFTAHKKGISRYITIPNQQISFFTFNPNTIVNCSELKWPLDNMQFAHFNLGTLNQASHNSIEVNSNDNIIIYRAFETKA